MTIPSVKEIQEELKQFEFNKRPLVRQQAIELLAFFSNLERTHASEEHIREMASKLSSECKNPKAEFVDAFVNKLSFSKVLYHAFLTLIYQYPLNDMRRGKFLDPNTGKIIPEEYLVILFDQCHWDARYLSKIIHCFENEQYENFSAKERFWIDKIAQREFKLSCSALYSASKEDLLDGLDFLSQQSHVILKSQVEEAIPPLIRLLNAELPIREHAVIALANLHRYASRMLMNVEPLFPFLTSNNPRVVASTYKLLAKYSNENQPGIQMFQLAGGTSKLIQLLNNSNEHAVLFALNMLLELVRKNHIHRNEIGLQCADKILPLLNHDNELVIVRATSLLWYMSLDSASCVVFYKAGAVGCLMTLLSSSNEEVVEFSLRIMINFIATLHNLCIDEIHASNKLNLLMLLIRKDNSELAVLSIRILEHLVLAKYYHELFISDNYLLTFVSLLEHPDLSMRLSALHIVKYLTELYPQCGRFISNQGGLNSALKLLTENNEELVTSSLCFVASLSFQNETNQALLCRPEAVFCFLSILDEYVNTRISINDQRYRALIFILKGIVQTLAASEEPSFLQEIGFYELVNKLLKKAEKPFLRSSLRWGLFNERDIQITHYNQALCKLLLAHQQLLADEDTTAFQSQVLDVIIQIKPFVKRPVLNTETSLFCLLERMENILLPENATVITW